MAQPSDSPPAAASIEATWDQILAAVTPDDVRDLLRPLRPVLLTADVLRIDAPNRPVVDYVTDRLLPTLDAAVTAVVGRRQIVLDIPRRKQGELFPTLRRGGKANRGLRPLNPRYTFASFVVGASNQFAHAASRAVSLQPGERYNPLFLYGGVGLGKTHLASAIGHEVLERRPDARVLFLSADAFMNELIASLQRERVDEFKRRFREADVLIIDDVHSFAGRERTQEEFFHTFNVLHELGRQVVLTSDRMPHAIPNLTERLRSRFEWGLVADIQAPDLETRAAIVERRAAAEGIAIDRATALVVAELTVTNVRELEGALTTVAARSSLDHRALTPDFAREVLLMIGSQRHANASFDEIVTAVATRFGVSPSEVLSRRRSQHIALPRQAAMYLCRRVLNASYPRIGEWFARDHSTVIHAVSTVDSRVKEDEVFASTVAGLERSLRFPHERG